MSNGGVDVRLVEAVSSHLRRHLGPIERVIEDEEQARLPVDVLVVGPTERRPFKIAVTCGMAARPMAPPEDFATCRRAELFLGLPPDWQLDPESLTDAANAWPVRLLRQMARFPHLSGGWLWERHTVGRVEDPPHGPGTDMNATLIAPAINTPSGFDLLQTREIEPVRFLALLPLHPEELRLARDEGVTELYGAFADADVHLVVNPWRPSAVL
jgi:hypothetical protein